MLLHPVVLSVLGYFKGALADAEFEGPPDPADPTGEQALPISDSPEVTAFVTNHVQRYWDRGMPLLQSGYEYGWIGAENLYDDKEGPLAWTGLRHFMPTDCWLLTQDRIPVGVRIQQVKPSQRQVEHLSMPPPIPGGKTPGVADLWLASEGVPAKGLWYVHNPRYHQYYGQSQLIGAWRPWRRLAWKDGAESVIDLGFYRAGVAGPKIGYPEEDYQAAAGTPATATDSQGYPRRYARDVARQHAEYAKAGAAIGLPTTKYPSEMGGGDKWTWEWAKSSFNGQSCLEYIAYLHKCISQGIGVPPELLEAAETGSGYSGRKIPLEGFFLTQQRLADNFLDLFVTQVLRPLVLWNFGPVKWSVRVKSLLKTKLKMAQQAGGAPAENRAGNLPQGPFQPGGTPVPEKPEVGPQPQAGQFSLARPPDVLDLAARILRRRAA